VVVEPISDALATGLPRDGTVFPGPKSKLVSVGVAEVEEASVVVGRTMGTGMHSRELNGFSHSGSGMGMGMHARELNGFLHSGSEKLRLSMKNRASGGLK
jgi:hypothetical protein